MKKTTLFLLALCVSLSAVLSGCAGLPLSPSAESRQKLKKVENPRIPELSRAEGLTMQSYMSGGRAVISGQRLYCVDFDGDNKPALCSYDISSSNPTDFKILVSDCAAEYLNVFSDRIYFINRNSGGDIESVGINGEDLQTVKEGPCDFLRIHGEKLYYCDSAMRFCTASVTGAEQEILMPEPVFYPYIIGDSLIYQQSENEHLYMRDLKTGADTELTDQPAYAPVIMGDRLLCTVDGGVLDMGMDGMNPLKYQLGKIQGTARYSFDGETVHVAGISGGKEIRAWSFDTDEPKESFAYNVTGTYSLCDYIDENYVVYTNYEPGGRIKSFSLEDQNGKESRFYSGKILS